MKFALLDIIFIGLSLVMCIRVTARGFIREFFSVAAFFIATLTSIFFYPLVSLYIQLPVQPVISRVISFFIIFSIVFLLIKSIQVFLSRLFDNEILGGLDKALGFFLGLVESLIIIIALIFMLQNQPYRESSELLDSSIIAQFLQPAVAAIPQFLQQLQQTTQQAVHDV